MHIDFGSHKLATMPPSRPGDNSLMVTKVLGLTPLYPNHTPKVSTTEGSSTLTGLGRGATSWVLFELKWTWIMGLHHFFPVPMCLGCTPWSIKLLPRDLLYVEYRNP